MAIKVFDDFLKEFERPITEFVSTSVSNVAAYVDAPLRTALLLYVVLYGYAVMRGAIREPMMDFAWRSIRLVVIVTLATRADQYQAWVSGLFFETLPREIGSALGGSTLALSSGAPFDRLLARGIEIAQEIYRNAGYTDIFPQLVSAILVVFVAVGALLQFAIMLYAKVGLGVVLALGPVFIALMLFEATRPFGEGWTRQLVNFVILQILVAALVGLMLTTVDGFFTKYGQGTSGGGLIVAAVAIGAALGLAGFIALQLPEIAGALAGGGASLSARMLDVAMARSAAALQSHGASAAGLASGIWRAGDATGQRAAAALAARSRGGAVSRR
ncbi:MAG TPA: type IV secretion system protein [Microvirga sp.]|jgi:type IV secretion system protein VirB6|nr:type IV secretion system protein [Microvirga sp.]